MMTSDIPDPMEEKEEEEEFFLHCSTCGPGPSLNESCLICGEYLDTK